MNPIKSPQITLIAYSFAILLGVVASAQTTQPVASPVSVALISPGDSSTSSTGVPTFLWSAQREDLVDHYRVEIAPPEQYDFPFKSPDLLVTVHSYQFPNPFRPDISYKWQVAAVLKDGSEVKSTTFTVTMPSALLPFKNWGLSLQKSYPSLDFFENGPGGLAGNGGGGGGGGGSSGSSGGGQQPAASFSFTHSNQSDKYAIDGDLQWSGPRVDLGLFSSQLVGSSDVHLSDDPKATEDAMRFRAGLHRTFDFDDPHEGEIKISAVWMDLNVKYATNREFSLQQISLEPLFSVNVQALAIGQIEPLFGSWPKVRDETGVIVDDVRLDARHGVWLVWRPYLGLDGGHALDDRTRMNTPHDFLRVVGVVKGELVLYDVARALSLQRVDIYAEDDLLYSTARESGNHFHDYLQAGIEFFLTKNVNLALQYKEGQASPTFNSVHSIGISLGIQF